MSGLYDAFRDERDACGIGFVADAAGRPSRAIVDATIEALRRVRHRGALAADARTGDGAGLLFPLPRPFLAGLAGDVDAGRTGVAMCFLDPGDSAAGRDAVERGCAAEGVAIARWREVPVDPQALGDRARESAPAIAQALLVAPPGAGADEAERSAFRARKRAEAAARAAGTSLYLASLSFRTVTYKALCAADQLAAFYPDLLDPGFQAPFAIFHQRYSTNTTPTWQRAQPFRMLCHNGEINTIQGNVNLMRAREGRLGAGSLADEDLLAPVIDEDGSDSAMLDNALELLVRGGRDIRHALAMLVPEAWEGIGDLDPDLREFYRYHACLTEPWDGPAGLIFTDGVRVGAALDRNGLRPLRFAAAADGLVVCASEAGVVDLAGHGVTRRGKLGPGQMLCVDPEEGGLLEDSAIKSALAARQPYRAWTAAHLFPASPPPPVATPGPLLVERQVAHGYDKEEMTVVIRPMANDGHEPTSSMGDDTQQAVLAERRRTVQHFLKQRFAQVTNPPIDHLRERLVMSLRVCLGPRAPLLTEEDEAARLVELQSFFLTPDGLAAILSEAPWPSVDLDATFPVAGEPDGLARALDRLATGAVEAVRGGAGILVVTDRAVSPGRAPVPSILATGAVHHALVRAGLRTRVSLVAATDEIHDVHGVACLLGYGAEAVCPGLVLETIADLCLEGRMGAGAPSPAVAQDRFRQAVEDGVLKVMSKMGVSTVDAYRSAQIFEAIGLGPEVIERCLPGTPSPIGGLGFEDLGTDVLARHGAGFGGKAALTNPGFVKHRAGGDYHATNPTVVKALHAVVGVEPGDEEDAGATPVPETPAKIPAVAHALQRAVRGNDPAAYLRFAELVEARPPTELRDLLEAVPAGPPVPLEEVEPAAAIVTRFSTGAMSHGSLSAEAHETLALALNMIGGKSNTGEGGEDPSRYRDGRNSRIKQVASGRFGVTPAYCAFADELQIKMAQGSKPGEGGQLPGNKVTHEIATLRHTTPGVALISPPPHHDIYSIEDLAQLIFDLKQVNPRADVSVKLVSTVGVGTIAAGVVKGLADVVHIAGADGGTGASPLSSIKHAGLPWEIGLAEAQQALVANGLRDRVRLRVDGGFKTGRDVVMAALLGADEYSFGTAALLAEGCIMVRTCHRDTCPVGIASQRPELRARFSATPEMVANYLLFVGEEVRHLLAGLGLRTIDEAVGRVELLRPRPTGDRRVDAVDLGGLLADPGTGPRRFRESVPLQRPRSDLGDRVAAEALSTLTQGGILGLSYPIGNADRAVGARLGGEIARAVPSGRPSGRVRVRFEGQAGQSFGAFLADGVEFHLTGEANDYVGKGMAGGRIVIEPPANDAGTPHLMGNTALYGATGGQLFCAGRAGERFAVRNSGAVTVVEGVGDHGCEYMTGGAVVILGPVGLNLAAGMTGGEVYVYDPEGALAARLNDQLVESRAPTQAQLPSLRRLIERHAALTRSSLAAQLVEDWDQEVDRFRRVATKAEVAMLEASFEGTLARA